MEILNQEFISVPFKIVLSLIAVFVLINAGKRIPSEYDKKGWTGIIDELVIIFVGLALVVFVWAMPLTTTLAPILLFLKFAWNLFIGFVSFITTLGS